MHTRKIWNIKETLNIRRTITLSRKMNFVLSVYSYIRWVLSIRKKSIKNYSCSDSHRIWVYPLSRLSTGWKCRSIYSSERRCVYSTPRWPRSSLQNNFRCRRGVPSKWYFSLFFFRFNDRMQIKRIDIRVSVKRSYNLWENRGDCLFLCESAFSFLRNTRVCLPKVLNFFNFNIFEKSLCFPFKERT